VERLAIHGGIVAPAVALVKLLTPRIHAEATGLAMSAVGGGLEIQNGCTGIEVLSLVLAAFCIVPLAPRRRVLGCLLGTVIVFIVNQARILALFYAARADDGLFDPFDTVFAPLVMVLFVAGYFHAWLRYSNPTAAAASEADAAIAHCVSGPVVVDPHPGESDHRRADTHSPCVCEPSRRHLRRDQGDSEWGE
jgi:exosortase/archaeosortase family protein